MSKKKTKTRIVLLDTHAILHRAYHALPDFVAPDGSPTGALYGLVTMVLKLASDLTPEYIVACYDLPGPTYRHHAFEGYKATREKMEDALSSQIQKSRTLLAAFGIPIYEAPGFEADDILGTIAAQTVSNKDIEIVIASGDMDTMQLVKDGHVSVFTLKKGIKETILYDEAAVVDRFGFRPTLLPDFKGLRGDPSDNIPGIHGIGEKTATTLITNFGGIKDIYKIVKKNPEKILEAGITHRMLDKLIEGEEDALFSKELATIRTDAPITFSLPKKPWQEGIDIDAIVSLFDTYAFRSLAQRVRSLKGVEEQAHTGELISVKEDIDEVLLAKAKIALWLLDSERTNPSYEEILDYTQKKSLADAHDHLLSLIKNDNLMKVYSDIELPLIPVVIRMKERGVLIDNAYLQELSGSYHKELETIENEIYSLAGTTFNINSPKQLGDILFGTLQLEVKGVKKTATGQRSTRESELAKITGQHPIVEKILTHRELSKLLSTYIDTIPKLLGDDSRLHADFIQTGTTTGRMASQNPNMQNLPIRTEHGKNIRKAIIAESGFQIVALDYSQIELRIAAILSGDEKLTRVFLEGRDIHLAVAAEVFGVSPLEVDKEMRRRAKVINFGILYGMGVSALMQNLGTSRKEAQDFYNHYFESFPGITHYLNKTKEEVRRLGYTETLFGRKRRFPGIRSPLPYVVAQAERMAVNAPIQGTQSDIIKIAMSRIHTYIEENKWSNDAYMIMQVHDELVFEVRNELVDNAIAAFTEIMEGVLTSEESGGITLKVDAETGLSWGDMQEL